MSRSLLVVFLFALIGNVYAKAHGPAGCGLGEYLFQGKEGKTFNILASVMNSSATQSFGISSGSLGCEDADTEKVTAVSFVEANRIALANDIARGGGETLNTYLVMIGRQNADAKKLQQNFTAIFGEQHSPLEIHQSILAIL